MKGKFRLFGFVALMTAAAFTFTSCGSSDNTEVEVVDGDEVYEDDIIDEEIIEEEIIDEEIVEDEMIEDGDVIVVDEEGDEVIIVE